MVFRVLLLVAVLVTSTTSYDDPEDTKPITAAKFTEKYKEYQGKMRECGQRLSEDMVKACENEENKKFRTITHRAVNSEVIEELSCKKGEFGKYEVIIDEDTKEVDLPC